MSNSFKVTRRGFLKTAGAAAAGAAANAVAIPGKFEMPHIRRKTTLNWIEWITPEISEEKMQGVLDAFYATDAGKLIEIERISLPYAQIRDTIIAQHLAGKTPDILNMNAPWAVELAEVGVLAPLNDFLDAAGEEWVSNLVTGPMVPWKGNIYVVPLTSIPFIMYYNKAKLADAGLEVPPATWADVEEMGPMLTDPSKNTYCYASGMAAKSPYNGVGIELFPLIFQSNGWFLTDDGKANWSSPEVKKAIEFWLHLFNELKIYAPGGLTNIEADKIEAFGAEQTALLWSNVAHVTVLEQRNAELDFGLAPLPEGDTFGTRLTGWNTSASATTDEPEAVWEFIHWLTGPEGNAKMTIAAKHLPGNTAAQVDELFEADPRLLVPKGVLEKGRCFSPEAGMPEVTNLQAIAVEQVHEMVAGKDVDEALADIDSGWNEVLAKYS